MRWQALQKDRPTNDPNTLHHHHHHHHRSNAMRVLCSDSQPPMEILDDIVQLLPNALSIPNETER